jgi:hypothetical protein
MCYVDEFLRNLVAELKLWAGRRWRTWRAAAGSPPAISPALGGVTRSVPVPAGADREAAATGLPG